MEFGRMASTRECSLRSIASGRLPLKRPRFFESILGVVETQLRRITESLGGKCGQTMLD